MDNPPLLMGTSSGAVIPSWLETPPLSPIAPPIETRHQELPFEQLKWKDFEKLCLRLARLEADVEDCRVYGVPGQDQEGIDLYARRRFAEKYTVYQCKREHDFGPAKIKEAVTKFLEGEWAQTSDRFVLCTTESLRSTLRTDEVERQRAVLRDRGIALETWDSSELSLKLKGLPDLVDDFFSREWVRVFCGPDAASSLGKRLDAASMVEFRQKLSLFYRNVFNTHDPGLPSTARGELSVLDLEQRYVIPDIYDRRPTSISFQQPTQHETHAGVEGDDERSIPNAAAGIPSSRRPMQRIAYHTAWRQDVAVIECLQKNFYDEDSQNQRAAAKALAEIASGDPTVGTRLATLARSAVLPCTRAVALEALSEGWPYHEGLASLFAEARRSLSPDLRFVAIWGRIRQGLHTTEDREELLRLGSWEAGLDFAWRDELAPTLLAGWPHTPEIKAVCFSSVWGPRKVDLELALRILLEGYSQDEDVIDFCVHQLERERSPPEDSRPILLS